MGARQHWDDERVERRLENFLACRDEWPSTDGFAAHGRTRLYQELGHPRPPALGRGPRRGLPPPRGARPYTEQHIRDELRQVLRQLAP